MNNRLFWSIAIVLFLAQQVGYSQESTLQDADTDADGNVTIKEFKEYAEGKMPGFELMKVFLKKVDSDGDGKISESEFAKRREILQAVRAGKTQSEGETKPENDRSPKTNKESGTVKKSYEKMAALIRKRKLDEAAKMMTQQGADEFAVSQVVSAFGLTEMDIPVPVPEIEETIDEIEDVIVRHKLDELGVDPSSMFRVQMSVDEFGDESDSQDDKPAVGKTKESKQKPNSMEEKVKSMNSKIIQGIDKNGKRWQIVGDLLKAKSGSPFDMLQLAGKVQDIELKEKVAYLEITPESSSNGDGGGVVFQMVAPPTIIRMIRSDQGWKFDGTDHKRTRKAIDEFMKNQNFGQIPSQMKDF